MFLSSFFFSHHSSVQWSQDGSQMDLEWLLGSILVPRMRQHGSKMVPKSVQKLSESKAQETTTQMWRKKIHLVGFRSNPISKNIENIRNLYVFYKIAFSDMKPTLGVQRCQRPSQNGAKIDQDGANMDQNGPLWVQMGPKRPQHGPK